MSEIQLVDEKPVETLDLLNQDDSQEDSKEKVLSDVEAGNLVKEESSNEDKVEEEKEVEKEEEEEEEEKIEIENSEEDPIDLVVPVKRKEILAAYPDLFKKFPYLEKAMYREQQYTEVFPTINAAKEAAEKVEILEKFEKELFSGNPESILKSVKMQNETAFANLVDNYLPTLQNVDPTAYSHLMGNIFKFTVMSMLNDAQKLENGDDLKTAAHLLYQYIFGNSQWQPPVRFAKGEEVKKDESSTKYIQQRFESARDDLINRVENVLTSTIDNHIDPKNMMSDYVRKNAVRDCLSDLYKTIETDKRFRMVLDSLWERAFKEDFSRASLDKIRSVYLARAKAELPSLIQKVRTNALKGSSALKRTGEIQKKGPLPVGKASSSPKISDAKQIPKGMKTIDFLMQD